MKLQYFEDTDTLHIEFRSGDIVESRDLDENIVLDLDAQGSVCAITVEHASHRTELHRLNVEGIAVSKAVGLKAETFDREFDEGGDVTYALDSASARRPNRPR